MNPNHILILIFAYFGVLVLISYLTGKDQSNEVFFKAKKQSPWYVVAFGMIGASLSGVTFISVPGWVGATQFGYMQAVLGYFLGMLAVVGFLIPLYYKLNVTSIYQYLEHRFGQTSYKTGAFFFLLSRVTGAAFRLFLVALTLQYLIFEQMGVPFWLTVTLSIALIWIYTFKSGIKTIVWTDTLQTFFMLLALFLSIYFILQKLDWTWGNFMNSSEIQQYNQWFFFDNPNAKLYFWKYFIGGAFITIAMTGLDQDMMQKNLTCKTKKESQLNMFSMYSMLILVNFVFLSLGALLFIYAEKFGIAIPVVDGKTRTDLLFPEIAMNAGISKLLSVSFIIGLIAAAYSSADSALTSLTTSVSVDFLNIEKKEAEKQVPLRKKVHIFISVVLIFVVVLFNQLEGTVVSNLFTFASYTYGPLLGLFAFGIFTKRQIKDRYSWIVALFSILITIGLSHLPKSVIGNYEFYWELLPVNGLLTFVGLFLISKKYPTITD
jgi:Na+/proline symporter